MKKGDKRKVDFGILAVIVLFLLNGCQSEGTNRVTLTASYVVDSIEMPEGLSGEVGALEFMPDGRLIASFRRGEVMIFNGVENKWTVFARGLHLPLGLLPLSNSEVLVMQYPELTRLKDTDGDGKADIYEKVTDDFGIAGNYHEFTYGPVRDQSGDIFIGLNSTSSGGEMMKEVRGEIKMEGFREKGMYSAVPYRGWIMKLSRDGKLEPYATGFRSPNGLGFDKEGHLLVTDNQGDWVGTSPLFQVEKGKFYGHPAGLVWQEGWDKGKPAELPVEVLDSMREKPVVLFPHNVMANSPTQPLSIDTDGAFGPFEGQILVGEMNQERIVRVMLEEVDGQLQGACVPFLDKQGLRKGNNRLAFAPDGSLWVGQNASGWAGASGIQRIRFTGKLPLDIETMQIRKEGFGIRFTKPVDPEVLKNPDNYLINSYYYEYHAKYGSEQFDKKEIGIKNVEVLKAGREVNIELDIMEKDRVYEWQLKNMVSEDGDTLRNSLICYTVNHLK